MKNSAQLIRSLNKSHIFFLCFFLFSCLKNETVQHIDSNTDPLILPSGLTFNFMSVDYNNIVCGTGWGRKGCYFLNKYNGTIWADADNYYSDFSDIKFSLFQNDTHFISFFNIDSISSYCKGWKKGETTQDGIKWNIKLKKDEWDEFWFDYQYYGTSDEIEYTITHKYKVVDSLLHFSTTGGEKFIFHPSERNYLRDVVDTDKIIVSEGCLFY